MSSIFVVPEHGSGMVASKKAATTAAKAEQAKSLIYSFSFPLSIASSPVRRGKEKRAFDASRLWHRQAPWEESKPKARKAACGFVALLPVFELGGFQTEENSLKLIAESCDSTVTIIPDPNTIRNCGFRLAKTAQGAAPPWRNFPFTYLFAASLPNLTAKKTPPENRRLLKWRCAVNLRRAKSDKD